MDKVSIKGSRILANYVLLKPSPDFEFIEIAPDTGFFDAAGEPIKVWIGQNSETDARHYGITGTVVVVPEELVFNKSRMKALKREADVLDFSQQIAMSKLVEDSLNIDVDMELQAGDKVWFHYVCQINAVTEKLLVDTVEHGMCFMVRYEELYCMERAGEISLLNGWVWVQRIEKEKTVSGIEIQYSEKDKYQRHIATVVKAGKPVRDYLDGEPEDPIELKAGEKVIYDDRFGFDMEYEYHRKLNSKETMSIRRKNIKAVI